MDDRPIIAVLPGSRKQEVSVKLPIMLEALKEFTSHQIVVAGVPTLTPAVLCFNRPFHYRLCLMTHIACLRTQV